MSLFDLLAKTGDKVKGLGNNLYNRIRTTEVQPITLNQLSEDGGVDIDATMRVLDQTTPLTLGERFTGRTLTKDFQKIDPKTGKAEMTTVTSVRPGLLNDISSGYQENRFNPVSIENLKQNTLDNGREKGFAYRLGEGLGSLARLGNSPLGRGLLVGGIVGASGGNGLEALTYGAGTTMLNQGNVLRDRVYRNDLINTQKQSLMSSPEWNNLTPEQQQARLSEIENSINNYRGYMTDDIYKNLVNTQQARDNAAYRQMYFDAQQRNLEAQRDWQRQQAEKENQLRQQQIATTIRGQNLDYSLGNARIAADIAKNNKKDENYENPKIILNNVEDLWKKTPQGRALKGTSKGKAYQTGIANALGMNNNDVSAYMAIAESMVTPLARQISQEKGNVSDRDTARARAMLPQVTDSYEQGMAKINAVRKLLNDLETGTNKTQNKDSLGIL